jgi:hypothetical protein
MSASVGEDAPTEDAIPGIHLLESSGDANRQEPEANLLSLLSIYRFPIKTSSWFGGVPLPHGYISHGVGQIANALTVPEPPFPCKTWLDFSKPRLFGKIENPIGI